MKGNMDAIIVDLIDTAKLKSDLILAEVEKASSPEDRKLKFYSREIVADAITGAVVTGVKLALDELHKRNKIK